jgi:hypothetical protein
MPLVERLASRFCSAQDNEAAIQTGGHHVRTVQQFWGDDVSPIEADGDQTNAVQWTDAVAKAEGVLPSEGLRKEPAAGGGRLPEKCNDCKGYGHRAMFCPNVVSRKQGKYNQIVQKAIECRICMGMGHHVEHNDQKPAGGYGTEQAARRPTGTVQKSTSNAGKLCRFVEQKQECPFGDPFKSEPWRKSWKIRDEGRKVWLGAWGPRMRS